MVRIVLILLFGLTASGAEKADSRERFGIWLVDTYRQSRSGSWTVGDARDLYRAAGSLAAADRALALAVLSAWMREQAGRADREAWWLSEAMVRGALPDPQRDPLQTQPTNRVRTAADLNLPAERTWAFQPDHAVLTAEWCRSLIALHRLPSVLSATEAWREQVGGNRFAQAMLAMAAADGMLQDDRIDQAVELIDLAQAILGQVREAAHSGSDEAPDVRLGRAMIDDLAQCIHRRVEVERYGPGWVAYRDADALRRRDRELFGAMSGFRKVDQEYPGTILAVAARANRLVLQMQTSSKAYQAERQSWLKRVRAQIDHLQQRLAQIEHDGFTSAERIAAQRALAAEQVGFLASLQAWPTDPRASGEQAWRDAEAFIAEKPEGLYRCDVMLAQAEWIWSETGDAGRARQRYDALLEWLAQVPARDNAIDGYTFEERIRAISAPPPSAVRQDDFGNQRWAALPPGTLINHRTCPWYVEYLTMRAAAGAGVCAFSVGDFAAASAYVDRLAKADPFEALRLAGKLQVSNTSRLRDGFATGRAPSSVAYTSKQDLNGQIPADNIGTKMSCEMVLQPTTVSFGNLFWFEEGGAAAQATSATGVFGYIAQRYGTPWSHKPSAKDSPVTDANVVVGGDKVGWSFLVDTATLAAFNSSNELKFRIPTQYVTPGNAKVGIETTQQNGRTSQTITSGTNAAGPFQTHVVTAYVEKKQQNNTNLKSFVTP